ncbi:MAG: DUF1499 domain-containing protein [Pseudomonadota bacterium]
MDFKTLERPGSPNTFLLAPDGLCDRATPDEIAPHFETAPADLFARAAAVLDGDRAIRIDAQDTAALRLKAVATTPLLRFKDDLDLAVLPAPGGGSGATLAIYSRSRLGHSDLGANARRVRTLVKNLHAT